MAKSSVDSLTCYALELLILRKATFQNAGKGDVLTSKRENYPSVFLLWLAKVLQAPFPTLALW